MRETGACATFRWGVWEGPRGRMASESLRTQRKWDFREGALTGPWQTWQVPGDMAVTLIVTRSAPRITGRPGRLGPHRWQGKTSRKYTVRSMVLAWVWEGPEHKGCFRRETEGRHPLSVCTCLCPKAPPREQGCPDFQLGTLQFNGP